MMLVGAAYMGQRMSLARQLAQAEQQRVTAEYELESARAEVFMLLSAVPRTLHGLGELPNVVALDGRQYRLGKQVVVSLQDLRGLVALNGFQLSGFGRERMERLLATYGIDAQQASILNDALLDYRDADDLRRLNGAEKEDYARAGHPDQIRNGNLLTPGELGRVFGWRDAKKLWGDDPITNHVSVARVSTFNPNTADWRALVAMGGISEDMAKSLIKSRGAGEVLDISPLVYSGSLGDPFGPNAYVTLFPSNVVIVTLRMVDAPWGYRVTVAHTPDLEANPWRIEGVERIDMPALANDLEKLPVLPDWKQLRDPSVKQLKVQLPF